MIHYLMSRPEDAESQELDPISVPSTLFSAITVRPAPVRYLACSRIPKASFIEHMTKDDRHRPGIRRQREARQAVRARYAHQSARRMQVLLGLAHIGALFHEL